MPVASTCLPPHLTASCHAICVGTAPWARNSQSPSVSNVEDEAGHGSTVPAWFPARTGGGRTGIAILTDEPIKHQPRSTAGDPDFTASDDHAPATGRPGCSAVDG